MGLGEDVVPREVDARDRVGAVAVALRDCDGAQANTVGMTDDRRKDGSRGFKSDMSNRWRGEMSAREINKNETVLKMRQCASSNVVSCCLGEWQHVCGIGR